MHISSAKLTELLNPWLIRFRERITSRTEQAKHGGHPVRVLYGLDHRHMDVHSRIGGGSIRQVSQNRAEPKTDLYSTQPLLTPERYTA
jgi:hypothetical protein